MNERLEMMHPILQRRRSSIYQFNQNKNKNKCAQNTETGQDVLGLVRVRPLTGLLEGARRVRSEAGLARVAFVALDPPPPAAVARPAELEAPLLGGGGRLDVHAAEMHVVARACRR